MRREQHRNALAHVGRQLVKRLTEAVRNGLQEVGLKVPVLGNLEFQIIAVQLCSGLLERAHVAAHDDGRVLRRHDDADQLLRPCRRFGYNVGDKRRSKAHSGQHLERGAVGMLRVQFCCQRRRLLARDAQQG